MLESDAQAQCAVHPEVAADATCTRCGAFMCEACHPQGSGRCGACMERLDQGRFVRHVPALGVIMMIHAGLLAGLGLFTMVYGGALADAFGDLEEQGGGAPPEFVPELLVAAMMGIGAVTLIPAFLQAFAGWRLRTYRSRWLGILALCSGLLGFLTCYCIPSVIGLLIWGLAVLLSKDVVSRFDEEANMREAR